MGKLIGFRPRSIESGTAVFELEAGPGTLIATGRVVKAGRTIGLTEYDVTDSEGRLIASAMSTCMTLRGESNEGR